jgi:hypothetical protein
MWMDPLSDVLSLLKPRSYISAGSTSARRWRSSSGGMTASSAMLSSPARASLPWEGEAEPVRLGRGDCFLLPTGRPFSLATGPGLTPIDAHTLLSGKQNGAVRTVNGAGGCFIVGGFFTLAAHHARMLLGVLPPIVHVRDAAAKAALRWSVERMMQELREPRPGSDMMAQHLTQMMLV